MRVHKALILPEVQKLNTLNSQAIEILKSVPDCSMKRSLANSYKGLTKKFDNFFRSSEGRFLISQEEEEIIRKVRSGEITLSLSEISEIPATESEVVTLIDDLSIPVMNEKKKKSKK